MKVLVQFYRAVLRREEVAPVRFEDILLVIALRQDVVLAMFPAEMDEGACVQKREQLLPVAR